MLPANQFSWSSHFRSQLTAMSNPASSTPPRKPIQSGGVFAALRRTKSVMNASDGELDGVISSGERLAGWSALLIVAALVAEAMLVFVPLCPLRTKITAFVTNSLIALGVFGELFFHKRSSLAQGELTRRSNDRLGEMEMAAGFANESAAMANERAAESIAAAEIARVTAATAILEQERLREALSWRRLSKAQIAQLVAALPATAPVPFAIRHNGADPEATAYASDLTAAFRMAGWSVGTHEEFTLSEPVFPGLTIRTLTATKPRAEAIRAALRIANITVMRSELHPIAVWGDVVLIVGPKPAPVP